MSQENVEPVRQKLSPQQRPNRTLTERLALRFPWFAALWAWVIARLSPSSRLRQALLARRVQDSAAAYDRGDIEVLILGYHPDVEFRAPVDHGEGILGLRGAFRGHDGYREFDADWRSAWGALRVEPQELIDLGDRLLVIAEMKGRGGGSGASVSQNVAMLDTLNRAGKVIREQRYFDHAEALEAVGIRE
jgi:uncharacterized protein